MSDLQRKLMRVLSSRTISFTHLLEFRPPLVLTPAHSLPRTPDKPGLEGELLLLEVLDDECCESLDRDLDLLLLQFSSTLASSLILTTVLSSSTTFPSSLTLASSSLTNF